MANDERLKMPWIDLTGGRLQPLLQYLESLE